MTNGTNGHTTNGHHRFAVPPRALPVADCQPPQSLDSERYVLSACVYENELIDELAVILKPDDFYRDIHQAFFRAVLRLRADGKVAEFVSVEQEMTRASGKDHCTSDEFLDLVSTLGNQPHAVNWAYHAGQVKDRSLERALIEAGNTTRDEGYRLDMPTPEKLARAEERFFNLGQSGSDRQTIKVDIAIRQFWETYEARENKHAFGVPTGLRTLDNKIGGCLPNTSLVIVAARPGHGKTAFALRVMEHVAERGMPVAMFSIEMNHGELMERMVGGRAKVNIKHLQMHSLLTNPEKSQIAKAAYEIAGMPIFLNDATDWTLAEMASEARRLRRQQGIGLLIIDYLQLLEGDHDGERHSRQEQIAKMSRGLKKLAKQLDIPIVALAQLNRKSEDRENRRPRKSDLRESGALEQDANMVFLLHRPEEVDPETQDTGIAEVIIDKNRNGETGMVRLAFVKEYARFEMLDANQVARYEKRTPSEADF